MAGLKTKSCGPRGGLLRAAEANEQRRRVSLSLRNLCVDEKLKPTSQIYRSEVEKKHSADLFPASLFGY